MIFHKTNYSGVLPFILLSVLLASCGTASDSKKRNDSHLTPASDPYLNPELTCKLPLCAKARKAFSTSGISEKKAREIIHAIGWDEKVEDAGPGMPGPGNRPYTYLPREQGLLKQVEPFQYETYLCRSNYCNVVCKWKKFTIRDGVVESEKVWKTDRKAVPC